MSKDTSIKVYIAAPFFTPEQVEVVESIEQLLEDANIEYFSPRSEGTLKSMTKEARAAKMGDMFRSNIDHMDWCTHCIAVIDDYDTGTVWEMGYLYATRKMIVTYSSNYHGINIMLNESIVGHCLDLAQVHRALLGIDTGNKTDDVT